MELLRPDSVPGAITALGQSLDTKLIAGGTAVVLMMRQGLLAPDRLVSLDRVPGLTGIRLEDDTLTVGARSTLASVAANPLVSEIAPALAAACGTVGNVRIRNVATLGGNIAEADYASDPPSAVVALGATITIAGANGDRTATVEDLITGFYQTTLEPDEVITAIHIPCSPLVRRQTYEKYRSRSSEDRPCVGVAAVMDLAEDERTIVALRVVIGAAAATPRRFPEIEERAVGRGIAPDLIQEIADGYAEVIEPLSDLRASAWYRKQMTRVFVSRALRNLTSNGNDA